MLLDIGYISQNLYLAFEGVGCGTCAIANTYSTDILASVVAAFIIIFNILSSFLWQLDKPLEVTH